MTELTCQGKYDKDGKKNGPVRMPIPIHGRISAITSRISS